eukprot:1139545-Pelagomonas_calceolata.AAC.2
MQPPRGQPLWRGIHARQCASSLWPPAAPQRCNAGEQLPAKFSKVVLPHDMALALSKDADA